MGLVAVTEDHVFYSFDPSLRPAAEASPGDEVIFYTKDALAGQITSEEQVVTSIDFSKVNPATGPLYVRGAEPGDVLVVDVLSIDVAERGFVVTSPGEGALGDMVRAPRTRECRAKGNEVEFLGVRLRANKMVGVIGVASHERPSTGTPGKHGGNMDTRLIGEGSRVLLPVEAPGALLGVGDLHAVMADGEACVSACEVAGRVRVRVDIVKGVRLPWPVVEAGDSIYIIASHEDLDVAVKEALRAAVEALSGGLGLDWADAYMLASLAVDVQVSQVVDPRKTARARIPKSVLDLEGLLRAYRT